MLTTLTDLTGLELIQPGLYLVTTWETKDQFDCAQDFSANWYTYDHEWPERQGNNQLAAYLQAVEDGTLINCYGSCDSPEQFLLTETGRNVVASPHEFCVTFRLFRREDEQDGGYRWHKNGPYLGLLNPQCEHLKDEPEIEQMYQFHCYRRVV